MATKYNEEDYKELIKAYNLAKETGERTLWERADYAHEAAEKYGGLKLFAKDSGDNYNTLKQASYLAGKYDKAHREFKSISGYTVIYRHFIIAAPSDSRYVWLQKAADNSWDPEEMRKQMNVDKPKKERRSPPTPVNPPVPEPEVVKKRNFWEKREPEPLEAAFKPFIESWNTCLMDKLFEGKSTEEIILLAFGLQDTYKLQLDPTFGYRIIPKNPYEDMEPPVKEGPSE